MPIRISFPKFRARTKKACDIIMNSAREHRIHNIGFRFITSRIIYIAGSFSTRVQVPKNSLGGPASYLDGHWQTLMIWVVGGLRDLDLSKRQCATWDGINPIQRFNVSVKDSLIQIQMINKWTASPIHKISSVLGKSSSWGGRVEDKAKAKKRDNVAECM